MLVSPARNHSSSPTIDLQVQLLGRDEREALAQVEPHLVAEDAARAGARAVALVDALVEDPLDQIEVGPHDRRLSIGERQIVCETLPMPSAEYDATPSEIRNFAPLQIGMVGGFLVLLFFMFGGSDADYPPVWLAVALVVPIAIGAFFAERVWLSASPLPADAPPLELSNQAVGVFAAQTVRKFFYRFATLIPAGVVTFVGDYGGWPWSSPASPGSP